MYAVFETGGKQYKAGKGEIVWVEKLPVEPGKTVSFEALVVSDGDKVQIGTPTVKGVKVKARVMEHGKEKKVVVFKYKSKDNYRKKQGHRQPYTKIKITDIASGKAAEDDDDIVIIEDAPADVVAKATKAAVKAEAAPKAKPAAEAKLAIKDEAKSEKELVIIEDAPAAETKAKPKAKPAADVEAAAELSVAPKAASKAKAAAEPKAEPKAKAAAKPKAAEEKAESKPKAAAKPKTAAKTEE